MVVRKMNRDFFTFVETDRSVFEAIVRKHSIHFDIERFAQIERSPVPLGKIDLTGSGKERSGKPLKSQRCRSVSKKTELDGSARLPHRKIECMLIQLFCDGWGKSPGEQELLAFFDVECIVYDVLHHHFRPCSRFRYPCGVV